MPTTTIMIDSTMATMGRLMKNSVMAPPYLPFGDGWLEAAAWMGCGDTSDPCRIF